MAAKALPVPTSLLVDANGTVLWMNQSENYQRRSNPDFVRGVLAEHLDATHDDSSAAQGRVQ
jgi:hypothetical protein